MSVMQAIREHKAVIAGLVEYCLENIEEAKLQKAHIPIGRAACEEFVRVGAGSGV